MADGNSSETLVRVTELRKTYMSESDQPIHACDGVSLEVRRSQIVSLTGPSGSGKSTLLHLIGALDTPDSGTITVDGREITTLNKRQLAEYRRQVGFVFQRFHLLPTLTVADNVMAPMLSYRSTFNKRERAHELLQSVGLKGRENALPSRLSVGQQQRVAIARAIFNEPALILADEPTGNLDSHTGEEIVKLLFELRGRRGITIILATHDRDLAERCDQVLSIRDGQFVTSSDSSPDIRL